MWHINNCMLFNAKSFLYKYVEHMIWFGWVLWHINNCIFFNAESFLYIYIEHMIWFGWVLWHINYCRLFNAKSFLYIYIRYMISKHFVDSIFKTNLGWFFYTQLNAFTYLYLIWIILWIELLWSENPATTNARHMETLDSCFDFFWSHQQCILWSPPLEIEPPTIE